jgi:hypothetical protein
MRLALKIVVFVSVLLISVSAVSPARAGAFLGWKSYSDVCTDMGAESKNAMTLGIDYRFGLLKFVKLAAGLDYSWGDIEADCPGCGDASFNHIAVRGGVDVPFWRPSMTEVYVGGGLSYNWVSDPSDIGCEGDNARAGAYGHLGVKISPPVLPVWFLVEGRYEGLSGEPAITVSSLMLGVGLGF